MLRAFIYGAVLQRDYFGPIFLLLGPRAERAVERSLQCRMMNSSRQTQDGESEAHVVANALQWLGRWLCAAGYEFVPPTPATHALVMGRYKDPCTTNFRDIFGWSRIFDAQTLPPEVFGRMQKAGLLNILPHGKSKSRVRFASLDGLLLAHSAYPTEDADAVFFGPDTYRFASFVKSASWHRPTWAAPWT